MKKLYANSLRIFLLIGRVLLPWRRDNTYDRLFPHPYCPKVGIPVTCRSVIDSSLLPKRIFLCYVYRCSFGSLQFSLPTRTSPWLICFLLSSIRDRMPKTPYFLHRCTFTLSNIKIPLEVSATKIPYLLTELVSLWESLLPLSENPSVDSTECPKWSEAAVILEIMELGLLPFSESQDSTEAPVLKLLFVESLLVTSCSVNSTTFDEDSHLKFLRLIKLLNIK